MNHNNFEEWFKNSNQLSEGWTELGQIWRKTAKHNMDILNENMQRFSKQFERLSHAHNSKDYFETLKDCLQEDMSAGADTLQKIIHNNMEAAEELTRYCGTIYKKQQNKYDTDKSRKTKHKEE